METLFSCQPLLLARGPKKPSRPIERWGNNNSVQCVYSVQSIVYSVIVYNSVCFKVYSVCFRKRGEYKIHLYFLNSRWKLIAIQKIQNIQNMLNINISIEFSRGEWKSHKAYLAVHFPYKFGRDILISCILTVVYMRDILTSPHPPPTSRYDG